ncbi:hypothetical protein Dimus_020457 [Dionaea muscipula]
MANQLPAWAFLMPTLMLLAWMEVRCSCRAAARCSRRAAAHCPRRAARRAVPRCPHVIRCPSYLQLEAAAFADMLGRPWRRSAIARGSSVRTKSRRLLHLAVRRGGREILHACMEMLTAQKVDPRQMDDCPCMLQLPARGLLLISCYKVNDDVHEKVVARTDSWPHPLLQCSSASIKKGFMANQLPAWAVLMPTLMLLAWMEVRCSRCAAARCPCHAAAVIAAPCCRLQYCCHRRIAAWSCCIRSMLADRGDDR